MRVFIVEDEPISCGIVERAVSRLGEEPEVFTDGESAWAAIEAGELPPLLLLDWLLPGIDGLELCRRIRARPDGELCIIVVTTSRDQPEDLREALDAGADDYLTKPYLSGPLETRLRIAVRRVAELFERKQAEARIEAMVADLRRSREDLLTILDGLDLGTALLNAESRLTFASANAHRLFLAEDGALIGKRWSQVLPLDEPATAELRAMLECPTELRHPIAVTVERADGRRFALDLDVFDDPRNPHDKILIAYDRTEAHDLRRQLSDRAAVGDLIGASKPMRLVFQQIAQLAAVDSTVLVEGETGTGKELVARAIHFGSHRRDGPFIAVNCAGLTESLIGSQLFGHRRGAFTGAVDDHPGVFEDANGGTLFLDEIGDLPLTIQASLLRALQEREVVRLGESEARPIDVRVLSATHRHLLEEVEAGRFRQDLLYRIRIAHISLPPLRQRREDIPLLATALVQKHAARSHSAVDSIAAEALRVLLAHPWPGNVRELENVMEMSLVSATGTTLRLADLPAEVRSLATGAVLTRMDPQISRRDRLLAALEEAGGNRTEAARSLGISRATLYRHLSRHEIPTRNDR